MDAKRVKIFATFSVTFYMDSDAWTTAGDEQLEDIDKKLEDFATTLAKVAQAAVDLHKLPLTVVVDE